ncbi:hypothetical protein [Vibrio parahaemolyticus]|uniref:HNH endonuclease n=1 Tax=Vibrio parahaemolyticus TaxID=670 RepID=A0AA46UGK6_VIBPH|nr:hypothetical protein [Vibrio parahaemolyticus]MCC3850306.1 hypothetical protein [Vibrio parahaemolyticus]UYV25302.1 hypothetical protein M5598_09540 [Vibrio parahaemolyticus]HCJ4876918.1 hypothetical protein [Vibrio parahaemolyticus]
MFTAQWFSLGGDVVHPLMRRYIFERNLVKKFKKQCIGCDKKMKKPTKEHFWPKWLIRHTKMEKHKIVWFGGNEVYPLTATIPLCLECNSELGSKLEEPMMRLLVDIEAGKGISDNEAEVFVRWAWKMEAFSWRLAQPDDEYSGVYTVKERVLKSINQVRGSLVLAVSLVKDAYQGKEYLPMGLCNTNEVNAIVMSGVIGKVAFIVLTEDQVGKLPLQYSYYRLNPLRDALGDAKLFYPDTGFRTFKEAQDLTRMAATMISTSFDIENRELIEKTKREEKGHVIQEI